MSTSVKSVVWLVLVLLLINFPLVQGALTRRDVDRSGTDVTATLVDHEELGDRADPAYWIYYRLPDSVDPDQRVWPRQVEQEAYDAAVAEGRLTVRVIPGEPVTARVPGQMVSRAGLVATVIADLLLLALVLVVWRFGRYGRPEPLRLEAVGDVVPAESAAEAGVEAGGAVDEDDAGTVTARGTLEEITEHDVVLDTGRRRVIVVLDGHRVLADLHGPAQVPGRRLG